MKALILTFAAVSVLGLAGCSNNPTASDFEAFASEYAEKISGDKKTDKGLTRKVSAVFSKYDLRKTDSVVTPFIGTAEYTTTIEGAEYYNRALPDGETKATYGNAVTVEWGWTNGKWEPIKAVAEVTSIDFPSLPKEQRDDAIYRATLPEPLVYKNREMLTKGDLWNVLSGSLLTREEYFAP